MGSVWQPTYTVKLADGSREKRKSNYYWVSYHVGDERVSENSHCTTKDGARGILKDRLAKVSTGDFRDFQRYKDVTLKEIADDLRAQYLTKGRRTVKNIKVSLARLKNTSGKSVRYLN